MDEELSVKAAPVTRLRRRLSVEPEDSPLPTTPSTPTKKRGRLATKPQLELIDEVVSENVPKKTTRKAAVKDAEPESTPTAVTPSRRSTRIRSNTSLLLETTTQHAESPRAKRALRRNSQLGSDTESSTVTPARQTRRTRKDSASSAADKAGSDTESSTVTPARQTRRTRKDSATSATDKAGSDTESSTVTPARQTRRTRKDSATSATDKAGSDTESSTVTPARQTRRTRKDSATSAADKPGDESVVLYKVTTSDAKPNTEGQEKDVTEDSKPNNHSPSTRRSPRLNKKDGKGEDEIDNTNKETNNTLNDSTQKSVKTPQSDKKLIKSNLMEIYDKNTSPKVTETEKENLSTSNINLINEMKIKGSNNNALNKSTSANEQIANDLKNKRNRTKSWTTLTSPSAVGFMSDIKGIKGSKTPNTSISGSGDGLQANDANNLSKNIAESDIKSPNRSINKSISSLLNTVENKENLVAPLNQFADFEINKSDTVKLFEKSPSNQSPQVVIDDSDSCSVGKISADIQIEGEDQCVPVVTKTTNDSPEKREESVEPMDIDESMPANVTIDDFSDKSNTSKEDAQLTDSKRKSSISKDDSIDKSNRKSRVSIQSETPKKLSIGGKTEINKSINKNSSISSKVNSSTLDKLNDSTKDKSNRSSISQVPNEKDLLEQSQRKSSVSIDEKLNESCNKSNRKSSVSQNDTEINQSVNDSRKSLDKSKRKSSDSIGEDKVEIINESFNKSKRNTSISNNGDVAENRNESKRKSSVSQNNSEINQKYIVTENNESKCSNKSKRSSSMSQNDQNLEKSGNENKSTLVISQLKDVASNDTNNAMSPNVTNELYESMNGPNVNSKGIGKKNLSLNYLTSTPIQQIPPQKLTMQINTSIISPAVDKNNSSKKNDTQELDSNSSIETDEEIKFKTKSEMSLSKNKVSSTDSDSDDESDTKSKTHSKLANKKTPSKKPNDSKLESKADSNKSKTPNKTTSPADSDSSDDSDDDRDPKKQEQQSIKKTPSKKPNDSKLESKADTHKTKTPNKITPAADSDSSDDSDEDLGPKIQEQQSIKKTPNKKLNDSKLESKADTHKTKTPNKITPDADSDSSDDLDEDPGPKIQEQQSIKKTPNRKLNDSKLESKADTHKTKTPNKITPAADSDSSDDSDEDLGPKIQEQQSIKKTPNKKLNDSKLESKADTHKTKTPNKITPDADSDSSDDLDEDPGPKIQEQQSIKKTPNRKLNDSKLESKADTHKTKTPNKITPDADSDSSDDLDENPGPKKQEKQSIKNTPNEKLNDAKLESKAGSNKTKTPNKITPTADSDSSVDSDEDSIPKKHNNTSKTEANKIMPKPKPFLDSDSSDPDEESSNDSKEIGKKTPNKKLNNLSKANGSKTKTPSKKTSADSSESLDDSDEDVPKNKSKIVDDEASEASDDYESGDSHNEEDRQYEEDNEIVEKGETLDSEEDFSDDSDYEKDSFLVSSDAEDHDMLSGTGDDLSMSDNELTMSAKSKKKFNERKIKQQKKASREMYEARHKKDESANSSKSETVKSKKSKRLRLESSTLDSENEEAQPKKSNRLRINSSQDSSLVKSEANESIGLKKKKIKRLSESVCEDVTMNEKEITLFNQSAIEKSDPLTVVIKQEPKTPLKLFNISTVAINENIDEVQVDPNASIIRQNNTLDPLQATMPAEDDDSSSSDNMEIIQNYDSVLNDLSMQTQKIKTVDTSLNLNKKSKNTKDPVFDQLNLTQTKTKKNKNVQKGKHTDSVKATECSKVEDDSSDSIDMKLLFSEDSNDSEINASQFKPKLNEPAEDFIPLKRTEAKINIHENIDKNASLNDSALNVSKKKNKQRKSSQSAPEEVPNIPDEGTEDIDIKIILDTTGTHEPDTSMAQTNSSKKKKNKKNKSFTEQSMVQENADIYCTDGFVEGPKETSFMSEKKKKKNKNQSFDVSTNNVETGLILTENQSAKKSKQKSDSTSEFVETHVDNINTTIIEEMPVNIHIKSDKKKNKDKNVSYIEPVVETAPSQIAKKMKKNSISADYVEPQTENIEPGELSANTSIKSEKKKKKKNKQDLEVSQTNVENTEPEETAEALTGSVKKNKQNLDYFQIIVDNTGDDSDEAPIEISYKSEKKSDVTDTITDVAVTPDSEQKKHKKNKKKNKNLSQSSEKFVEDVPDKQDGKKSKKRKASQQSHNTAADAADTPSELSNDNKKRKIHLGDEVISAYNNTEQNNEDGSSKKSKKNKKSKNLQTIEQDEGPSNTNNKKRKNRDNDDGGESMAKISKQNSSDKIHVPILPESVINQLTDKPQNMSKKKNNKSAIATVPFMVEEAERRKNKPSNYLEQSVYLNDTPDKEKQKKPKHKKSKPKVLPFIPTALTSDSGYTSKFNINVLPADTQFIAQASNVENFRESFLGSQRIKKLGTFERCKRQRSHKLSKF